MKKGWNHIFITGLLLLFVAEAAAVILFVFGDTGGRQDSVLVNEAVQAVQADWEILTDAGHGVEGKSDRDAEKEHRNKTGLAYVVLDRDGTVLFRTGPGLSESVNRAVLHRDTILDLTVDGQTVGKIIIDNDSGQIFRKQKQTLVLVILAAMLLQCGICIGYFVYLDRAVIKPFQKLEGFAQRVAGGNLDIPLTMDRQNLFGAFTESFDIMRSELRKARMAEAKANASKKELVAKLSHDIKTPVASIKAASEVGAALTDNERLRDNYVQIIRKADQINALITNLFTATLEELRQLTVTPGDMESTALGGMIESADYLHRGVIPGIPGCMLYADPLRLQQVFDNIFANSYKYAGTKIDVTVRKEGQRLNVCVEDYGGGVRAEELPLLKEKFKRGSNAGNVEGAGLGLYISDYFMKEMEGELTVENGEHGLKVIAGISMGNLRVSNKKDCQKNYGMVI